MAGPRPTRYHFGARWVLQAPYAVVFDALADLESYPRWWPAVRQVVAVEENSAHVRLRSRLPYTLDCTLTRTVQDRDTGHLEVKLTGDLCGYARWRLTGSANRTTATYEQRVQTTARTMRLLAPVAHPVFRLNHRWMMQDGHAGLQRRLDSHPGPRTQ